MEKNHYVMPKVLHNNIDSSRLSQENCAAEYHSYVNRIEFYRTLMPQFSWMILKPWFSWKEETIRILTLEDAVIEANCSQICFPFFIYQSKEHIEW